eukprot:2921877-Rhodomonas_salina.2
MFRFRLSACIKSRVGVWGQSEARAQAGTLAGFAQRIAERVTEVIADCQWEGRVCVYVLPPALHSHIHAHWRAFAAELEQRLRDDGVWDHVSTAPAHRMFETARAVKPTGVRNPEWRYAAVKLFHCRRRTVCRLVLGAGEH